MLRSDGEDALTIERLCTDLARTKGSFYHHFVDLAAYQDALLARWEARDTEGVIRAADVATDAGGRRVRLEQAVRGVDTALDVAVRAWGLRDARVRMVVDRVDARRIEYLASLYRASGLDNAAALRLGRVEYAAFVGAEQLFGGISARAWRDLQRTLHGALGAVSAAARKRVRGRRPPA